MPNSCEQTYGQILKTCQNETHLPDEWVKKQYFFILTWLTLFIQFQPMLAQLVVVIHVLKNETEIQCDWMKSKGQIVLLG